MTSITYSQIKSRPAWHFIRHYIEMWIAMGLGMALLFMPVISALGAVGVSRTEVRADAPALMLLGMAVSMTIPMVVWMRYRGHGWSASNEMAASMFIPTFAVIALLWADVVTDFGALMTIEHVAMIPSMLVAMLLRREEYSHGVHGHGADARRAAA